MLLPAITHAAVVEVDSKGVAMLEDAGKLVRQKGISDLIGNLNLIWSGSSLLLLAHLRAGNEYLNEMKTMEAISVPSKPHAN